MKTSLERTAILSKDITEQDLEGAHCIVILPDINIIIAAQSIEQIDGLVSVKNPAGDVVATFPRELAWICIDKSMVDVVSREAQLRRHYANLSAEAELLQQLVPDDGEIGSKKNGKHKDDLPPDSGKYGVYL